MGSEKSSTEILKKSADTIRCLAMDAIQKANSGHPGMPMGCADFAALLWGKFLKHDPSDPRWHDRDRFVLSPGHGSMLLYSLLHLSGYGLSLDEIKNFRQWGSLTPGHPEVGLTAGVETTTGPLGQGFGNGVGMALAEAMLAERFNQDGRELVNHYTYGIVSDGDLMEGVAAEAASLAGHLKLGKLIYFYDSNRITIDGTTDLTYSDDVAKRFEGYHWHVMTVDGHDTAALEKALLEAQKETVRPSLIIGQTHIALGSPNKQDTSAAHGAPLGAEEIELTKKNLGWDHSEGFYVPEEVPAFFAAQADQGRARRKDWQASLDQVTPEVLDRWHHFMDRKIPVDLEASLPVFSPDKAMATRVASGQALNKLAAQVESLVGGSADLAPSNMTWLADEGVVGPGEFAGRNMHYGIREHGMGAIMNGMALHGGLIPYGGTFLIFSDYMRSAMRVAALSKLPVIYVLTHDSFHVGEDGPTHQPVEQIASLRLIPNLCVIRPSDPLETGHAWLEALKRNDGPTALILSRQGLPLLDRSKYGAPAVDRGAYCLKKESKGEAECVLLATGSEVPLALEAAETLESQGHPVRVVAMPCWELFEAQPASYQDEVIPPSCKKRLALEAGITAGWERYVGDQGRVLGMTRFGASAPGKVLQEKFGFTVEKVLEVVNELL